MPESRDFPGHAIAIVGLSGRFPGAADLDQFWENLRQGREELGETSEADLIAAGVPAAARSHPLYVRKGTHLEGAESFDAAFFGLSPREAQILDPQHRIFLECAWEALEHAGYGTSASRGTVGVYGGASMNTYLFSQVLRDPSVAEAAGGYQLMLGNDKDFLCTRVSYKLDLRGPSLTIQTACSTSLVAVEMACRALRNGECDMALAGGVSVTFPLRSGYLYQDGMILSPDGHCRPFDSSAAGTRPGAGAGIVVLKRLSDALAAGDTIHAVIRGAAVNNDGADKVGYTAPSIDGQVEAIATAQALAGVDPRTITYLEAHGTATPLGDPIEIRALTEVFRASTADVGFCRLGSLKANLGHLDAAAGVAGLIKTVLALGHAEIPPLANFRAANPQLALHTSPFAASAELTPWETGGAPRRAGVSSFGIGGTNAHVVLEEAPPPLSRPPGREGPAVLVVSAMSQDALMQASENLAAHLERHPDLDVGDVAWTLHAGRKAFACRRTIVAADSREAARLLRQRHKPLRGLERATDGRPVAFLFSGQGSQHPGMGAGLHAHEPVFRDAVDRCAAILRPHVGLDIRDAMFSGPSELLSQTRLAQPALFTLEYALAVLWQSWGVVPSAMMGHSVGEYVAAHLAGVMTLEDALLLVAARGRLMQGMAPGSMAAIPMSAVSLLPRLPAAVEIAAVNAPELCSIAGPKDAVQACLAELAATGIEGRLLHTSHAFHSAMMEPALSEFVALVRTLALRAPTKRYVSNLTGTWITSEQATSPDYYASHLRRAVQFEPGLRALSADSGAALLEVGPGTALATLARACLPAGDSGRVVCSLSHPRDGIPEATAMRRAAGDLWSAGVTLDAGGLHGPGRRRIPLPTYPFERTRYSVDGPPVTAGPGAATSSERIDAAVRLYAPTWTRDMSPSPAAPSALGTWVVFGEQGSLTGAIAERLRAAGADVSLLHPGTDLPAGITSSGASAALDGLVYAGEPLADPSTSGATAGYAALMRFAALVGASGREEKVRVIVASRAAQSVFGEPVRNVDAALSFGAVLALPSELPMLSMRSVDLDPGDDVATAAGRIFDEAVRDDAEPFVAWRAGCRWLRRYEPLAVTPDAPVPLKPRGVYLITGGLGGLGLALAQWLASTTSARLLLTSRSALPPRESWQDLAASDESGDRTVATVRALLGLEKAGAEVMIAAADAADPGAMSLAIEAARERWGGIDGVIHAAGVPGAGNPSFLETVEEIDSVIAPKRDGLTVLATLLGERELDFVVLMSSINAIGASPNAGPYAAANAVLDSYVESDRVPVAWRRVISINWTAWREIGMAANLPVPESRRAEREAFLRQAIEPRAGIAAFAQLLGSGRRRAVVTSFDLLAAMQRAREHPAAVTPAARATSRTGLIAPPSQSSSGDVESRLASIWTELLGVEQVAADDDFFALGGHSLLATRVLARINSAFGVRLALRDVFDARTLQGLAGRVTSALGERERSRDDEEEILI